jgi:hypothetical protein
MNTVNINIFDSYSAMTAEQKEAVLGNILLDELYREEEFKVRLEELLTTEQDDALLSRIIEMLGGCLADAEFRNKLTVITGKYQKNSLSYNAVRELMITALFVGSGEVKSWGSAQLKEKEELDPSNETKLVNYLKNILNDFNLPLRLRWQAALALANHGTQDAINALISFAQYLTERLPENETDDYYDSENLFLAEKIAYCIGFAADKMQLSQLNKSAEFFMKLHNIIDESSQIQWARERIEKQVAILPQPKPAIPDIVQWIRELWIPWGAGQLLTAADNSKQEKSFFNGTVKIACIFAEKSGSTPAYIWLSWNALKTPEHIELIIQLVNSDTKEVLFELCLGDLKEGEQAFSAEELSFDPAKTPWAIHVGVKDTAK